MNGGLHIKMIRKLIFGLLKIIEVSLFLLINYIGYFIGLGILVEDIDRGIGYNILAWFFGTFTFVIYIGLFCLIIYLIYSIIRYAIPWVFSLVVSSNWSLAGKIEKNYFKKIGDKNEKRKKS